MTIYKKICCLMIVLSVLLLGTKVHAAEHTELLQYIINVAQGGPVYEVIPDGSGDFSGIQEAVEQVESGATLLIYPGTYEENVEIVNKTVNLIGVSRDDCIIISDTMNYHHVPLMIGAGTVYNMTICGSNPTKTNMESDTVIDVNDDSLEVTEVYELQNQFAGYAIHIDQHYSTGRELLIEGCRIISDSNHCVGIGCKGGSAITFADCQFFSNGGGCLYLHNAQSVLEAGDTYFTMRNCELNNYLSPYVMSMYSVGDLNPVYLTFQNVKVGTVVYESKTSYKSDNMNTWYSIDLLDNSTVRKLLNAQGYYTPLGREMIRYCDSNACADLRVGGERESLLGNWPELPEGILYICGADGTDSDTSRKTVSGERKERQVIWIGNKNQDSPKDGWCGLNHIYLTEESYGNTLIEMNYPRTVLNEVLE